MASIEELLGKTIVSIDGAEEGSEEITIRTSDDKVYSMLHLQDCCENVRLEEIVGDPNKLVGDPVLQAEESSEEGDESYGTSTWTFYRIATVNGHVVLRWLGESNGYYSESVDFYEIEEV